MLGNLAAGLARRICTMIHDPIVDEVRKAREEYAKQFSFDLDAMFDDLQRRQRASGRKTVSFPLKWKLPVVATGGDGASGTWLVCQVRYDWRQATGQARWIRR